ncbi:MAG: phosphatase PAP2 family protein [Gemmatimonadetes bacterium]|nr:phosphatase PAP2 family protein [Gemmatimonadota bacterium]
MIGVSVPGAPGMQWTVDIAVQRAARDSSLQAVPALQGTMRAANWWGGDGVVWFAALLWLGARFAGRSVLARIGLRGAEALAVGSAISGILKGFAGRARPFVTPGEPWHWEFARGWTEAQFFSMPSGHTTATTAFAVGAGMAAWRHGVAGRVFATILVLSAVAVAAGRVFANQHWLSDVIVGMLLGSATAALLARLHARGEFPKYTRAMLGGAAAVLLLATPARAGAQWSVTRVDLTVLSAGAGASAIAMVFDESITREARASLTNGGFRRSALDLGRQFGSPGALAAGAAMYGVGKLADRPVLASSGRRALEAIALSGVVTGGIKAVAGRARPSASPDRPHSYSFMRGLRDGSEYQSFPSGHATSAFAFASAVSGAWTRHGKRPRWVAPTLYGLAALTAASRVYDHRHWASDVILGGAIGIASGRIVQRGR